MELTKNDLRLIVERLDLCYNVYNSSKGLPAGWELVASTAPDPKQATGFYGRLYKKTGPLSPKEGRYLFAFRGTHKASDLQDLATDINILVHRIPRQYEKALAFVKKTCAEQKIDPKDVEMGGHSSGGYLARAVAMTVGAKTVWAFNSPGPSSKTREAIIRRAGGNHLDNNNLVQIRSTSDVVGKWGYDEGIILEVETKGDHHALASLRRSVVSLIEGVDLPVAKSNRKYSIRNLYNELSQKVTHSTRVRHKINKLFGVPETPRSSIMRPRPPFSGPATP